MTQKKQFRKRNCGGGFTVCVTVPAASLLLLACFSLLLHWKIVGERWMSMIFVITKAFSLKPVAFSIQPAHALIHSLLHF
jgi:hypothetical protein